MRTKSDKLMHNAAIGFFAIMAVTGILFAAGLCIATWKYILGY